MILDLKAITEGPQNFEYQLDEAWWHRDGPLDHIQALDRPLQVKIEILRVGEKVVIEGTLSVGARVLCDRCLEPYHRKLEAAFKVFLALPTSTAEQTEIELLEDDMAVDFIKDEAIDLDDIVKEQIHLSLPMKTLCSEKCLGLCATCGGNLNKNVCRHQEEGHPVFSKLKNLKL